MKTGEQTACSRVFPSDAKEMAFLLGGIGTGNVSVGARGELKDWEIFNWPDKHSKFPFAFFAIWAKNCAMQKPVAKILESRLHSPFTSSHGYLQHELVNLPRFKDSTATCEYPFIKVAFYDDDLPVQVEMEAFTPFIPLNADDSGIPATIVRYHVRNTTTEQTDVSIVGTLPNAAGFKGYDVIENLILADEVQNEFRDISGAKGLYYQPKTLSKMDVHYGNMAIMTTNESVTYKTHWFDGEWVDGVQDFWDDFTADGRLDPESHSSTIGCEFAQFHSDFSFLKRKEKIGSIGSNYTIAPGEERIFEFVISWYFPNRVKAWIEFDKDVAAMEAGRFGTIRNYYATKFSDAWDAGTYLICNMERLENESRAFQRAVYHETTLPKEIIDAMTSNITTLRSNTCFRLEDGTFCGFEGIRDHIGCGYGSVPHVWNYAQTVAFLFPELEKTMRRVEFAKEVDSEGCMSTRMFSVFDQERYAMVPACDGQLGSVVRLYREFRNTGDLALICELWPHVIRTMDYAFRVWDRDGDDVLDGQQNTTYDIEFYGPNPMTQGIFLAALAACEKMAAALGDEERRRQYHHSFEKGSKKSDELLFNGEYYRQSDQHIDQYRYQYGEGCLSDQLLGQFLADMAGLSDIWPEAHMKAAVQSIFQYNFKEDFFHTDSVHRAYAINDEKGLVIATWPKGGRSRFPLSYAGEVWTGVEYEVAALLIRLGFVGEGVRLVRAVRDRYDGYKRNPYSEVESGHHYTRAMSSFGVYKEIIGMDANLPDGTIRFSPKVFADDFSCFFICGCAWGIYRQKRMASGQVTREIEVLYGSLKGIALLTDPEQ